MSQPDTTAPLPDGIRKQLLGFHFAGLLDDTELNEVSVAVLQHVAEPAIDVNLWSGNRNAPPILQRGI